MADRFESREAVAGKIEWEGGLTESLDYGIKAADMPEGDAELAQAWEALDAAWGALQAPLERVAALLGMDW